MCTKVESVSVRWNLYYECVCGYDLRCDGGWDDLWSWPPFQPCITIIAWAGLERIILQQGEEEEEEGGLLLGIFFYPFWLWLAAMKNCDDERPGAFQWPFFFFCARCCVSVSFLLFTWHSCVQLLFFSMYLEKRWRTLTTTTRARPCCCWLMSKRDISVLFIYLFILAWKIRPAG